jgi:putative ABC transport system ATP-binding protein
MCQRDDRRYGGKMIELERVSKTYERGSSVVGALVDVTLRIEDGEFVAIAGPSGSGKSTLMNIIGFLDRPDTGTYRFRGDDVAGLNPDRLAELRNEKVGFVFQSFHLLPKTSALENVELPLIYSERADITGLGARALEQVGLSDRADHHPGELSGGQQQRVAIARALVNEPDIILADEPTGNLDTRAGLEVMATFQELNRRGKTVIVVTHDPEIAGMARRRVQIVDGRIVSNEPVADPTDARASLEALGEEGMAAHTGPEAVEV